MKIVINTCHGGFGLSKEAYQFLRLKWDNYGFHFNNERDNSKLVECVEKLGERASGECSNLKVVEIPDGINWEINEYDGSEHIAEKHRIWR